MKPGDRVRIDPKMLKASSGGKRGYRDQIEEGCVYTIKRFDRYPGHGRVAILAIPRGPMLGCGLRVDPNALYPAGRFRR